MTRLIVLIYLLVIICLPKYGKAQDSFSVILEVDSANINFDQFKIFDSKYYIPNNYFNQELEVKSALIEYDATNHKVSPILRFDSINFGPDPIFIMQDSLFYIFGRDRSLQKDLRYYNLSSNFKIDKKFTIETTGEINYTSGAKTIGSLAYLYSSIDSSDNRYALITKINSNGDILWKRYYFKNDIYSFIIKIDEFFNNTILFSSGTTKPSFPSQRRAQLTQIDTSGNILWEYIPDEPMSGGAVPPWFAVLSDSTIVLNYSINKDWDDPEDWNRKLYKFVWIDQNGQHLKERYIPHHWKVDAYIADVKAGKQGDYYFTFGREEDVRDPNQSQAVLTKYNNAGDTIWHRSYAHPDFPNEDFQYSMVEMEEQDDGSFVLLVKISTPFDYNKAWLFTVDSMGCFYTDSCGERLVVSAPSVSIPEKITKATLFPNPTREKLMIRSSTPFDQLVLYNMSGEEVLIQTMPLTEQFTVNTGELHPGMYIVHLRHNGKILERLKFVKQ